MRKPEHTQDGGTGGKVASKKSGVKGGKEVAGDGAKKAESGKRGGGILGTSRAQLDAARLAADASGSEDEGQPAAPRKAGAGTAARTRRALPGRLRKKLAKEAKLG